MSKTRVTHCDGNLHIDCHKCFRKNLSRLFIDNCAASCNAHYETIKLLRGIEQDN